MVGAMSPACREIRPVLAECLMLGVASPEAATRHLDGCRECRREASEIRDVVRTLRRASPGNWSPARYSSPLEVPRPPDLGDKGHLGIAETARVRVRRRHRLLLGPAVVAAAAVITTAVWLGRWPTEPKHDVAVTREGQMVSHGWGTEIPVVLTGLNPGRTYRVMTADAAGNRAPGGGVRISEGETVHMRITTALPRQAVTVVLVEDESGREMARMSVSPAS
ncbi:hypothetical protein AB0D08_05385 [Kitasatospora sp. NPDC048540]|uniref:hypothetical protein n=1 Tax=Kitasatospora sp. NPDC048540 TaxID=3155634 RepID=UPI0033EF0C86